MLRRRPVAVADQPAYPTQGALCANGTERARAAALIAAAALAVGGCGRTPQESVGGKPQPPNTTVQPQATLRGEVAAPVVPQERLAGDVMTPQPVPLADPAKPTTEPAPVVPQRALGGAPPPPKR